MREIKFRAWDSDCDVMFDLFNDYSKDFILKCLLGKDESITVMQFTGLKDIYESDIVEFVIFNGDFAIPRNKKYKGVIEWAKDRWQINCKQLEQIFDIQSDAKAIGNIHENPKLLEEDK